MKDSSPTGKDREYTQRLHEADQKHTPPPAPPITETDRKEPGQAAVSELFLVLNRDADFAPTYLIPRGTLAQRLRMLETCGTAATLDFDAKEIDALAHFAPHLDCTVLLILTKGLEAIPGARLLTEAFDTITAESALHRGEDIKQAHMRDAQTPRSKLQRALLSLTAAHEGRTTEEDSEDDVDSADSETLDEGLV